MKIDPACIGDFDGLGSTMLKQEEHPTLRVNKHSLSISQIQSGTRNVLLTSVLCIYGHSKADRASAKVKHGVFFGGYDSRKFPG